MSKSKTSKLGLKIFSLGVSGGFSVRFFALLGIALSEFAVESATIKRWLGERFSAKISFAVAKKVGWSSAK